MNAFVWRGHCGISLACVLSIVFGANVTLSGPSITNCSIAGFPGAVAANVTTETGSTKTFDAAFLEFCDSFLIHSLLRIMNEPSSPGDQCRRTVRDRWSCQHVGDIPGFRWLCFPWGSGNLLGWFLLEELMLSSASKHLILSPQPQSPGSSAYTTDGTKHVEDTPLENCAGITHPTPTNPSWKLGEWKLGRFCRCAVVICVKCKFTRAWGL